MANLNKVLLIGRFTRDPESITFNNSGKVVKAGFVVNERKKSATGQWEDTPIWLDVEFFNRGDTGKLGDTVEKYCRKGSQVHIEGRLTMEEWNDKTTGQKRTKLKIVADAIQLLDGKQEGSGGIDFGKHVRTPRQSALQNNQPRQPAFSGGGDDDNQGGGSNSEVPF